MAPACGPLLHEAMDGYVEAGYAGSSLSFMGMDGPASPKGLHRGEQVLSFESGAGRGVKL